MNDSPNRLLRPLLLPLCALLLMVPATALALDGEQILAQVDRNLQPRSYEMYRKLINLEPDGSRREFVLYTLKKGEDKMVALFLAPASEKGRATLRLGENIWLYIPKVGRPIRITSLQSVIGGVFNNADILRLDFSSEYRVEQLREEDAHYLLTLKARTTAVAYDSLIMEVEKKRLLPTTIACHAASGMLIKTLRYSEIKDFGGGLVRPARLETDSPLHKGYRSIMLFARLRNRSVSDEVFSLNGFAKVDELR
ncbi:outer membrane lipoprotein-sorting protein [Desulfogranum mediterraneum]|uniref:outer membrane lipoprotein-sorting protein n=1 Tax=Desulfogranum mediterraneum TaxID=160661 RepID=UPI0004124503|nr:outer membrane lipoprotein-sorting protein [Desulfogranum mediterraneum]